MAVYASDQSSNLLSNIRDFLINNAPFGSGEFLSEQVNEFTLFLILAVSAFCLLWFQSALTGFFKRRKTQKDIASFQAEHPEALIALILRPGGYQFWKIWKPLQFSQRKKFQNELTRGIDRGLKTFSPHSHIVAFEYPSSSGLMDSEKGKAKSASKAREIIKRVGADLAICSFKTDPGTAFLQIIPLYQGQGESQAGADVKITLSGKNEIAESFTDAAAFYAVNTLNPTSPPYVEWVSTDRVKFVRKLLEIYKLNGISQSNSNRHADFVSALRHASRISLIQDITSVEFSDEIITFFTDLASTSSLHEKIADLTAIVWNEIFNNNREVTHADIFANVIDIASKDGDFLEYNIDTLKWIHKFLQIHNLYQSNEVDQLQYYITKLERSDHIANFFWLFGKGLLSDKVSDHKKYIFNEEVLREARRIYSSIKIRTTPPKPTILGLNGLLSLESRANTLENNVSPEVYFKYQSVINSICSLTQAPSQFRFLDLMLRNLIPRSGQWPEYEHRHALLTQMRVLKSLIRATPKDCLIHIAESWFSLGGLYRDLSYYKHRDKNLKRSLNAYNNAIIGSMSFCETFAKIDRISMQIEVFKLKDNTDSKEMIRTTMAILLTDLNEVIALDQMKYNLQQLAIAYQRKADIYEFLAEIDLENDNKTASKYYAFASQAIMMAYNIVKGYKNEKSAEKLLFRAQILGDLSEKVLIE